MRKLLYIGIALACLGGAIGYYMYNKPHADMSSARPDVTATAATLFSDFEKDEQSANEKYLGKIVRVSGKIAAIQRDNQSTIKSLTLDTGDMMVGVSASLDEVANIHRQSFKEGEAVTLNCVCAGKLMDIELNRCVEIKK